MTSSQGDFAQALAGQAQQQTVSIANQISVASLKHVQNAGTTVDASIRSSLNLIAGTGVTLAFADDSGNDRVSVTVSASQPGLQLDYAQITSSATGISAGTEGTATSIIASNSITYSGARVKIEFYSPEVGGGAGNSGAIIFVLFRDATVLGQIATYTDYSASSAVFVGEAVKGEYFDTPSAGSHTYTVKAWVNNSQTMYVGAGAGGSGTLVPAFLRVTVA